MLAVVPPSPGKDAAGLIDDMLATVQKWHDYTCKSQLDYFKGDKPETRTANFFYKDNQVRVEVTGGGYRDGSVVIKNRDGKVHAKGGLMMAFIQMDLDPDSRMLIMPNGINVTKSDLPDLLTDLKHRLSEGSSARVTATPVSEPTIKSKVLIVDIFEPDKVSLRGRMFVDPDRHVPVRWDMYRNGERVSSAWFNNLRNDVGLDDKLFRM